MKNARFVLVLVVLILVSLSFAACGSGSDDSASNDETTVEDDVSTAANDVEDTEETVEEDKTAAAAEADDAVEEAVDDGGAVADAAATEVAVEETANEEVTIEAVADPLITVNSEVFVGDVVNDKLPTLATVSSLGGHIAWPTTIGHFWNKEGELCLYSFEGANNDCYISPEIYEGYPYAFAWSPADEYVAFTENPILLGYESDIWLFDVAKEEFVDRTDDGVEGDWIEAEPGTYWLDYLPMWNETDDMIYFWRSVPITLPVFTLDLYRIAPEAGEAELVRDLSDTFKGELPYFGGENWFMDGVSAISPDGSKVAMLLTSTLDPYDDPNNGLWIVDLKDESVPPQQLMTIHDMQRGAPAWAADFPLVPVGLSWSGDSKGVVVMTYNQDEQVPMVVLYYVDVESGEATPVVDFSDVPDGEAYWSAVNDVGLTPRYYSPWTASMSPKGDALIMYNDLAGLSGVLTSPLPPTGELPQLDYISQIFNTDGVTRSSRADDGKVLIYNILFGTTEKE
jgi:hypothetical protein